MYNETLEQLINMVRYGSIQTVKNMVEKGIDLEYLDLSHGSTALMYATQCGHLEIVKYLVEKGANVHTKIGGVQNSVFVVRGLRPPSGITAIQLTTTGTPVYNYLKEKMNESTISTYNFKNVPNSLENDLIECCKNGIYNGVVALVEKGANINGGTIPLMTASTKGYLNIVKYLVEQGALIEKQRNSGFPSNAIESAICNNKTDVVEYLYFQKFKRWIKQHHGRCFNGVQEINSEGTIDNGTIDTSKIKLEKLKYDVQKQLLEQIEDFTHII
jgi:ankyrin repeat protein